MGDTTRLKRVREFIADQTGHPLGEITLSTRLVEEVGVDGNDAVELMEAFMEEFHVDMSDFPEKWGTSLNYENNSITGERQKTFWTGEGTVTQ